MAERGHRWPIRVYYEDTDAAGIVYHAQYLCFCERARTEFLRAVGHDHRRLKADLGLVFAVRRAELAFRRPAHLDDLLEVVSGVATLGGARVVLAQRVERGGTPLAEARIELALVDDELRPRRVPMVVADGFRPWIIGSGATSKS